MVKFNIKFMNKNGEFESNCFYIDEWREVEWMVVRMYNRIFDRNYEGIDVIGKSVMDRQHVIRRRI